MKKFQNALKNKLDKLNKNRDELIRERVAKLVFGPSIVRVFKSGTKDELIPFLSRIKIDHLKELKSEKSFTEWFQKKSEYIAEVIKIKKGRKKHAHAPKILALYCRALLIEYGSVLPKGTYKRIEKLLFVPIDSYVIKALKALKGHEGCEALEGINSMGDFKPGTFMAIQDVLKAASDENGVPRIVFDYVWAEGEKQ